MIYLDDLDDLPDDHQADTYNDPMKLCRACARRQCEDRGPDCDTDCQCPCAAMGGPEDVAAFARILRQVPPIRGMR